MFHFIHGRNAGAGGGEETRTETETEADWEVERSYAESDLDRGEAAVGSERF